MSASFDLVASFYFVVYRFVQTIIVWLFAPNPKNILKEGDVAHGRIAVIGAGLTGVSSAAHAVAHGFDVVIYEGHDSVGGVWANVNKTSGLQLNSALYRFHPAVVWSRAFPHQPEIMHQIKTIWKRYGLEEKTRFGTRVEKVERAPDSGDPEKRGHSKWLINDGKDGEFDAVIAALGTCGEPKMPKIKNSKKFTGQIVHSSKLDDLDMTGKRVVIVGSGASAVEAAELAVEKKAERATILARHDKWFIPRNFLVDCLLACQPLGRQTPFSFVPEYLIRKLHYRDLEWMSPSPKYGHGLFAGTPIVNDAIFEHIRAGKTYYKRGDVLSMTQNGVLLNKRKRDSQSGDQGEETEEQADYVVMATGFERPSLDFLPEDLFPEDDHGRSYKPPNMYLQTFAPADWSVLFTNSAYNQGIATVGHIHIGIYARILMLFLLDHDAPPKPGAAMLWVDLIRWIKERAPGGAFAFFTYGELCAWFALFFVFQVERLKWVFFVLMGFGVHPRHHPMPERKQGLQDSGSLNEHKQVDSPSSENDNDVEDD